MYWIHPNHPDAAQIFRKQLLSMINDYNKKKNPLLFVCIGTPTILGDTLGPLVGTILDSKIPAKIYGTLNHPVHAMNYEAVYKDIKKQHQKPFIIAIDAALGTLAQSGYILLKKGPLLPGKGVGKKLSPIGHIQITGVFQDIFLRTSGEQMAGFSRCISQGILELYPSFQSTQERDFVNVLEISANRNTTGNTTYLNTRRFD